MLASFNSFPPLLQRKNYNQTFEMMNEITLDKYYKYIWTYLQVHRWVENVHVLERFLEVLPDLRKYTLFVMEKKLSDPHTKSFDAVKKWMPRSPCRSKVKFCCNFGKASTTVFDKYQAIVHYYHSWFR